jgi:hypothetical protein
MNLLHRSMFAHAQHNTCAGCSRANIAARRRENMTSKTVVSLEVV